MARVIASATSGTLRDSHYVRNPVTGTYERATLLEKSSTNLVLRSEDFSNAAWTKAGPPAITSAAHTASGITLDAIGDDDATAVEGVTQDITFTGNAVKAISIFVKAGSSQAASGSEIVLSDTTAGANRLRAVLTFSAAGVPSVTATIGTYHGAESLVDGVYRLYFTTTSVTAANTNTFILRPAMTSAEEGNIYAGGVQAENSPYPTAYIATAGATVTRNADTLYFPFTDVPQALTVYVKGVERGSGFGSASAGIMAIGGQSNAALMLMNDGTNRYTLFHRRASDVQSQAAAATAWGDLVELHGVLYGDGSVALGQAINGAAEAVAATSGANALAASWSASRIYIGERNGDPGAFAFLAVKVALGVKTLQEMRDLADMEASVLVLNAGDDNQITVPCAEARLAEPEDIGGRTRAFAGNLLVSTRDQKRAWQVTTSPLTLEEVQAIETLTANNAPIPCSGIILDQDTVTCSVKVTSRGLFGGTTLSVLSLVVAEV